MPAKVLKALSGQGVNVASGVAPISEPTVLNLPGGKMVYDSNLIAKSNAENCRNCIARPFCLNQRLNHSDLLEYESFIKHRTLRRGDRLFRQGEPLTSLYVIRSGSFKAYLMSDDGEQQITGFHFSGELLGMDGLRDGHQVCYADALETSSICELPYRSFEKLMDRIPLLRKEFIRYATAELAREKSALLVLGKMVAERKLANFFLDISSAMHDRGRSSSNFVLSMQRQDIGNYLGLAIETVSRLISRFQYAKLLEINHRQIRILDRPRLVALAKSNDCYTPLDKSA